MNKIINLLDHELKLKLLVVIYFMVIASVLELLGLGFVIIILNAFLGLDTSYIDNINKYTNNFFNIEIGFQKIILIIISLFTLKFIILSYVAWIQSDFIAQFREKISNKLYHNFLNRDVKNLLSKNSAEYIRNFTEEILTSITFITSCLKLILDSILILSFLVFLIYFNPLITLIIYTFFSFFAFIYFIIFKNKLSICSIIQLENKKKNIKFIILSFLAIKTLTTSTNTHII